MKAKRPKSVTWLAVGVLMVTGLQWLRVDQSVRQWQFLHTLDLPVAPIYFYLSGLVWGGLGLLAFVGIWRREPYAPAMLRWTSAAFTVYYWADQMLMQASPLRKNAWPFTAAASLLCLAAVFWILARPHARRYFGDKYE